MSNTDLKKAQEITELEAKAEVEKEISKAKLVDEIKCDSGITLYLKKHLNGYDYYMMRKEILKVDNNDIYSFFFEKLSAFVDKVVDSKETPTTVGMNLLKELTDREVYQLEQQMFLRWKNARGEGDSEKKD